MQLKQILSSPWFSLSLLWVASMAANVFNWLFNVVAGRTLSLAEFGNLTLFLTFQYLISVFSSALGNTTTRFTYLDKEEKTSYANAFLSFSLIAGLVSFLLYVGAYPLWSQYFQFYLSPVALIVSGLMFFIIFPLAWTRGSLNALKAYALVGITLTLEAMIKLLGGWLGTLFNPPFPIFLSAIPLSMGIGVGAALFIYRKLTTLFTHKIWFWQLPKTVKVFFAHSLLLQIGIMMFLNIDVLLVKHFFNPEQSGIYSLLSLIGKTILFLSYSFIGILTTYVSTHISNSRACRKAFYIITIPTILIPLITLTSFIVIPQLSLGLLLGTRYHLILPYLLPYCFSILGLIIALLFSNYHLLKQRYIYPTLMIFFLLFEIALINFNHQTLQTVISCILLTTSLQAFVILILQIPRAWSIFRSRELPPDVPEALDIA